MRASLQLVSSSAHTLGSGSLGWLLSSARTLGSGSLGWLRLLSVSRRWASLSGLPNFIGCITRQSVSLSGGGQRLITVSETSWLLTLCFTKQPASVSASAGLRRGFIVRACCPLSAELWLSPCLFLYSRGVHRGYMDLLWHLVHLRYLLHLA